MGDYSVLLPGSPQTAAQAANEAFPGATSTPQYTLPEITVTAPRIDTTNWDLNPIQVTAQKMKLPAALSNFNLTDWFKPPKLFLTIGLLAVGGYLLMNLPRKRKRRR